MEEKRKVKCTYLFPNNMVVTFDTEGKQISELQGEYTKELEKKIKAHSTNETLWEGF